MGKSLIILLVCMVLGTCMPLNVSQDKEASYGRRVYWYIEDIIGPRTTPNGDTLYLILWKNEKGFPLREERERLTWEVKGSVLMGFDVIK